METSRFRKAFYGIAFVSISLTLILSTYFTSESAQIFNLQYFRSQISPTTPKQTCESKSFVCTPQEDWQKVEHPDYTYNVYSAYSWDDKNVNIIAGTRSNLKNKTVQFHCEFSSNTISIKHVTTVAVIKRYPGYITCPLPNSTNESTPYKFDFVSILPGNQTSSSNRLPIIYRDIKGSHREFQISACVLPLYWYDEVFHFIEWLEYYKLMGVEHFTFYNISIGPSTSCVMNHISEYSNGEISVKVNPWHNYPLKKDNEIRHQISLMQAINECVFTHKGVSKYMIEVDVDEFITSEIPYLKNYHQLIEYLLDQKNGSKTKIAEFRFRNAFYLKSRDSDFSLLERCAPFRNNFQEFLVCQQLFTMKFDKRDELTRWQARTKYIVVPEGISFSQNHNTGKFVKGYVHMKVPENVAIMRHYRYQPKEGNITTVQRISDYVGESLVVKVAQSLEYFSKVCKLTDAQIFKTSGKF